MQLGDIAAAARGRLTGGRPEMSIGSISTDSRTLRPGELFVALVGERFDAHTFVATAVERGAAAVVAEQGRLPDAAEGKPTILVEDTTRALQDIARASRARYNCTVIAVTGSNGKTTTKDFVATLASRHFMVVESQGSFNNHVGVPLTLLNIDRSTELAVVEIGMSAPGEIRTLAAVAQPQVGVITNVNPTHLESFEAIATGDPATTIDPVAAIADAKAELLEALPADGTAVLNADNEWVRRISARWTGKRITYGTDPDADVQLTFVGETAEGSKITLRCFDADELHALVPVPGRHNALNAAAAVAACCAVGMRPEDAVEAFADLRLPKMRFERHTCGGALIINDAYNANPESVRAALATFGAMPVEARRFVVCGPMLELGTRSIEAHREIGRVIAAGGFDRLVVTGGDARYVAEAAVEHGMSPERVTDCEDVEGAAALVQREIGPGDAVLIKGSRANRMERIVEELVAAGERAKRRSLSRT